jgi:putative membrane protein
MNLIIRLVINALIILLVAYLIPGIAVQGFYTALIVAIVLGIISVTLKPLLLILTLPINLLTLGLFTFVINALLLWFTASIVKGFEVTGFISALIGSLLISILQIVVRRLENRPL